MMLDYVNFTCFNNVMVIAKATYLLNVVMLCKTLSNLFG